MRKSKIFISLSLVFISLLTGCLKQIKVDYNSLTNGDITIEETKLNEDLQNVRFMDNVKSQKITIKDDNQYDKQMLNPEDKVIYGDNMTTIHDIILKLNRENTKFEVRDYESSEKMIFNYTKFDTNGMSGIYITHVAETKRKLEQYYNIEEINTGNKSYNKIVTAIKYKDKANNALTKGIFKTTNKKRKIELDWTDIDMKEDPNSYELLQGPRLVDLGEIKGLYEFNDSYNWKGKTTIDLAQFLTLCSLRNQGVNTIKDQEVIITKEEVRKGVKSNIEYKYNPLTLKTDCEVEMSRDDKVQTIIVNIDLNDVLTTYYKLFKNYGPIKHQYRLEMKVFYEPEQIEEMEEENEEIPSTNSDIIASD